MATNGSSQESFKHPLPLQQFIHGEWVDSKGKEFLTLRSAVDDSLITEKLSCATAADIDEAVISAEKGLAAWQAIAPEARRAIMNKFADLIVENGAKLAYYETLVVGKPISMVSAFESANAAESFRYYAGFIDKNEGELTISEDGFLRGTLHQPLGVCAAVIPFNSPVITFGMKVAPCLAAGNSIIVKASEFNPLSAMALGEIAIQAGIPAGTINMISGGVEAGQAMSSHMRIRKISFTGSPIVGRKIQQAAAGSNLKRVTLELGGKSPVLIFDDADIDNAAANTASFLAFNGQGCVLGTRALVQEGVADEFLKKLTPQIEGAGSTLGADPFDPTTFSSPLFHHRQRDTVVKFLESGRNDATVITGGHTFGEKGCYVQPTIFYKPKVDADIWTKEIFGPVLVVQTFKTEEEALKIANDTEYGLGAYVYTRSMDRALRLSKALEAGSVAVNIANPTHQSLPFGGWKSSGIGSENGKYGLRAFTQPKAINIKFNPSVTA